MGETTTGWWSWRPSSRTSRARSRSRHRHGSGARSPTTSATRTRTSPRPMARRPKRRDPRALAATGALAAAGAAAAAGKVRVTRRRRAQKFELADGETIADGVRRIAYGQLDIAEQLDVADERSVHEARKAFKRLRALVRLTRDQLGDQIRRHENVAFRDAGRELSGARDARVLVETLDALAPERFAGLRAAMAQDTGAEPDEAAVKRAVADARERVDTWPLGDAGADALAPGMKR